MKPSAQEVSEYAKSIDFALDGQYFLDSNEARGWVVGKSRIPMKDWKAVVRTWKYTRQGDSPAQPEYDAEADAARLEAKGLL